MRRLRKLQIGALIAAAISFVVAAGSKGVLSANPVERPFMVFGYFTNNIADVGSWAIAYWLGQAAFTAGLLVAVILQNIIKR